MNIFGGNTGMTYEDVQRKRAMAEKLVGSNGSAPRNTGEGLHAIGRALAARSLQKQASRAVADNPEFANYDGLRAVAGKNASAAVIEALMSGAPNFARGGTMLQGGQAVVGENGPEVVRLPRGAQVYPAANTFQPGNEQDDAPEAFRKMSPEQQQEFMTLTPDEKMRVLQSIEGPEPQIEYEGPRDFLNQLAPQEESRFNDAAAYQTADMSGISPSGAGERNQLNAAARSFQGLMKSMQDYEKLYEDGGSTMWPGERKDKLDTAHRDLQMQMKELYNLGVLNGPDLDLMNQILLSPTSITGNIMDAIGVSDMEKRIPSNIKEVRRMMINRTTPALQQLGIDPESLMPKEENADPTALSDDDLMKALIGGS